MCVFYLRVVCFCTSVTSFQFFLCTAAVENYLYAHHLVLPIHERILDFKLLLMFHGFDPP